jgi:predicted CopG family antitoxin
MKTNSEIVVVKGRKNISINDETYNKLAKLGDLSETFDEVINRLIDEHNDRLKEQQRKR